jgi:hypothetical protein
MDHLSQIDLIEALACRIVTLLDAERMSVAEVKGLLALVGNSD